MQQKFLDSHIDGFVYFTANMPADVPGQKREMLIWAPAYRDENNDSLARFVNNLGERWIEFYQRQIGQEIPRYEIADADKGAALLRSMKFIKGYKRTEN